MADDPNGNGSDNPNGDDAPENVTPAQMNKAITAHLQRFEKKQEERLDALVEKLSDQLKPDPPEDAEGDDPKGEGDDERYEKLQRKFEKKLEEAQSRVAKIEQEREEERQKNRDMQLRQSLRDELASAGIEGAAQKAVMALLVDGEKRVSMTDDGDIQFTDTDGLSTSLREGVGEWLKSDDAKLFLPARGGRGSGERPNQGTPPKNAEEGMAALDEFIASHLK